MFDYHKFLSAFCKFCECKTIVEIGTQNGDCSLELCDAAQHNQGKYFGYDVYDEIYPYLKVSQEHVQSRLANAGYDESIFKLTKINTRDAKFQDILKQDTDGKIDFAFIDADHSYEGVTNDFLKVYKLLTDKGFIAFHDTYSHNGCRKFVLDLYTTYNDGAFDIINLPYGGGDRRFGLTILAKRSYPVNKLGMWYDAHDPNLTYQQVYQEEYEWYQKQLANNLNKR